MPGEKALEIKPLAIRAWKYSIKGLYRGGSNKVYNIRGNKGYAAGINNPCLNIGVNANRAPIKGYRYVLFCQKENSFLNRKGLEINP